MLISLLSTTARRGNPSLTTRWENRKTIMSIQNKQVLCRKCGETDKFYYCAHCDFKSEYKHNMKRHMETKHSHTQEDVNQQTEPSDKTVKCNDMVEAAEVLKIYKLLQRMKNK